jgi:predicted regulator of Ras-like GTPase activity (Roadblock/LC7/MglB family)
MTETKSSSASEFKKVLERLNEGGPFPSSVVTDQHGLPIAFASQAGFDPERQSAVVALIQRTMNQAGKHLGMSVTDEFMMFDANGQRLVCRPFNASGYDLILTVIVPTREQSYRRSTTQAINEIRRIWTKYLE